MFKYSLLIFIILIVGCYKSPEYTYEPTKRVVCHQKFRAGKWYPQQFKLSTSVIYRDHIGWHPNDYWGYCREEIVPIPEIKGPKDWEREGYFPVYRK